MRVISLRDDAARIRRTVPDRTKERSPHDGWKQSKHNEAEPAMGETPIMAGELNGLSVAIGRLQSQMETLTEAFKDSLENTRDEHRKVHDIVAATAEAQRVLTGIVADMRPYVEDYREKRAEARGAKKLLTALYFLLGSLGGISFWKIIEMFGGKPPPH